VHQTPRSCLLYLGESEVSCVQRPVPGSVLMVIYNPVDAGQSFQVDYPLCGAGGL
jgi:hypothetical protein